MSLLLIGFAIWFVYNLRKAKLNVDILDASFEGDISKIRSLLRTNVDVDCYDKRGFTPLILASAKGHTVIVKLLLTYGANPRKSDNNGVNAFHHAVMVGNFEIAEILKKFMETGEL